METYLPSYYSQKGFALIFAIMFFGGSLYGLTDPENFTVSHNGNIVESNFQNLLPFFIIGALAIILFVWMTNNYFRIKMDDNGISILNFNRKSQIEWEEIQSISSVKWFFKGTVFKVILKRKRTFYFYADKPKLSIPQFFNGGFQTKMAEFVESKKQELNI